MDPFLGEIKMFAGNFAPRGWAFCQGQLMSIAQNNALFALLGTTYGGDGKTTFALPDLRGRGPIGFGTGPGLADVVQGEAGGVNDVTLLQSNMPMQQAVIPAQTVSVAIPAVEGDANAAAMARTVGLSEARRIALRHVRHGAFEHVDFSGTRHGAGQPGQGREASRHCRDR